MTTPASPSSISMLDVIEEIDGLRTSRTIALDDADVRELANTSFGSISMNSLRGKTSSILKQFTFGTITSSHGSQSGTISGIVINTDGTIRGTNQSGGLQQDWKESGSESASNYEVSCSYNFGGQTANNGDALDTWHTISQVRSFAINSGGNEPVKYGNFTIQIRKISNINDVVTESFNLETKPL